MKPRILTLSLLLLLSSLLCGCDELAGQHGSAVRQAGDSPAAISAMAAPAMLKFGAGKSLPAASFTGGGKRLTHKSSGKVGSIFGEYATAQISLGELPQLTTASSVRLVANEKKKGDARSLGTNGDQPDAIKKALVPLRAEIAKFDPQLLISSGNEKEERVAVDPNEAVDLRPYRIRTGDSIRISIPDEPETIANVPVQPDGRIRYLFDIEIVAAGLTYKELHDSMIKKLARYYRNPRVTVIGESFAGNSVFVMGPVKFPGSYTINNNTRLLHVLARAGALSVTPSESTLSLNPKNPTREVADLDAAYIVRDGKKLDIDFRKLIVDGDQSLANNPILKPDDFIFIPSTFGREKKIFLTGFVGSPQVYRFTGKLTFLEAILQAGGTTLDFTSTTSSSSASFNRDIAQNHNILIIRTKTGEVKHVDYQKIRQGKAENVVLVSGDIIFVPEHPLARGSRKITQVISEILAPLKAVLDADSVRRGYKNDIF